MLTSGQLNETMKLDADLTTMCGNLTGEGNGGACDLKALGISVSTPILMMSTGVLGNLLALLVLFTADRQVSPSLDRHGQLKASKCLSFIL